MAKMRQWDYFQTSFYFLKKLNMRWKQVVCSLVLIYFDNPQIAIQLKQTVWNFRLLIQIFCENDMINLKRSHSEIKLLWKLTKKQPRSSCVWKCYTFRSSHLKVQSWKFKKRWWMIVSVYQKYPENFAFQLFII